jgi:hypothetical protein
MERMRRRYSSVISLRHVLYGLVVADELLSAL